MITEEQADTIIEILKEIEDNIRDLRELYMLVNSIEEHIDDRSINNKRSFALEEIL